MIDEIRFGPLSLQLVQSEVGDDVNLAVLVNVETGVGSMGVAVTQEQWDEAARIAGMRGMR